MVNGVNLRSRQGGDYLQAGSTVDGVEDGCVGERFVLESLQKVTDPGPLCQLRISFFAQLHISGGIRNQQNVVVIAFG